MRFGTVIRLEIDPILEPGASTSSSYNRLHFWLRPESAALSKRENVFSSFDKKTWPIFSFYIFRLSPKRVLPAKCLGLIPILSAPFCRKGAKLIIVTRITKLFFAVNLYTLAGVALSRQVFSNNRHKQTAAYTTQSVPICVRFTIVSSLTPMPFSQPLCSVQFFVFFYEFPNTLRSRVRSIECSPLIA